LISKALADDLIDEKSFFIPAANIVDLSDPVKFAGSIRKSPELPFDVQLNWPPDPADEQKPDFMFTDGKGSYKVYFLIKGGKITFPVNPAIS